MKRTSRVVVAALISCSAGVAVPHAFAGDAPTVFGPPAPVSTPAADRLLGPPLPGTPAENPEALPDDGTLRLTPASARPAVSPSSRDINQLIDDPYKLKLTSSDLLVGGTVLKRVANPSTGQAATEHPVFLAEDPVAAETPNIHGFLEVPFKTAYVTPRGLVVENAGVVIQPVGGLVFPIGDLGPLKDFTFVTGIWNSINSAQGDTNVGPWNEMDYFATFSWKVDAFDSALAFDLSYGAWNFPQSTATNKPSTEHNIDLKISYNDSKLWGDSGFALNPYADIFWAVGGSSTVVLGRGGDTGYVELGIVPSIKVNVTPDLPVSFTFPTYFSVGPENYWGTADPDGHFGVFSTAANATIPLNFIPVRLGHWHATAGVSYFYLINDNLLAAGNILSGNNDRNVFVGSLSIGVNF